MPSSKKVMKSFIHPEIQSGECFVGDIYNLADIALFKYRTRRVGNVSYRRNGTVIIGAHPVFVSLSEI